MKLNLVGVITRQAMDDLELDALDLTDLANDQVRKLGAHSRTKKAINVFGAVGQQTQATQFAAGDLTLNIETRRNPVKLTISQLVVETSASFVESAITSLMLGIFDLMRWAWRTCTANSVIVLLLVLSALFNGYYSSRDTFAWYHERNAGKFMSRLGVRPNTVMSKALYVRDFGEAMDYVSPVAMYNSTGSCFATFQGTNALSDLDAPLTLSSAKDDLVSKSSARRLQRTRQRLGGYRHDLLVAMRVVNSIEKEVLQTEWESWLAHENRRCNQVGVVLAAAKNETEEARNVAGGLNGRVEDIERWFNDYCTSCQKDHEALLDR